MSAQNQTVDDYIAGFSPDVQKILKKMRSTIKKALPKEATEAVKYGVPTFMLNKNVIHYAGFKHHVAVYPAPRNAAEFKKELENYEGGKGTAQFPLDEPIPYELISRIAKFRAMEDMAAAAAKAKKKPSKRK